jgi:hypothetical protein
MTFCENSLNGAEKICEKKRIDPARIAEQARRSAWVYVHKTRK